VENQLRLAIYWTKGLGYDVYKLLHIFSDDSNNWTYVRPRMLTAET